MRCICTLLHLYTDAAGVPLAGFHHSKMYEKSISLEKVSYFA